MNIHPKAFPHPKGVGKVSALLTDEGVHKIAVSRAYTFVIVNTASPRPVILRNGAGEASFGI
jgi:hypothetical protein